MKVRVLPVLLVIGLLCAAPVFGKDYLAPSPTSASLTLAGGTQHDFAFTYSIGNGTGNETNYGSSLVVTFSIGPTSTAPASIYSGGTCTLFNKTVTCPVTVRVTAPAADPASDKAYTAYLTFKDSPVNELKGENNSIPITITVPKSAPSPIETTLDLSDACGTLRGKDVTLTAVLKQKVSGVAISGEWVEFFVGSVSAGSVRTNSIGAAAVTVPVGSLPVGDTPIKASFAGTSTYIGSNDEAKLGLTYIFQGFMPPMNADGTSVFKTGRVIPFKIRILDGQAQGGITNATPEIGVFLRSTSTAGTDQENALQGTPDASYFMRYTNTTDDQYIYNWDLTLLTNGTYDVKVDLNDSQACGKGWVPTQYGAVISVEKRK